MSFPLVSRLAVAWTLLLVPLLPLEVQAQPKPSSSETKEGAIASKKSAPSEAHSSPPAAELDENLDSQEPEELDGEVHPEPEAAVEEKPAAAEEAPPKEEKEPTALKDPNDDLSKLNNVEILARAEEVEAELKELEEHLKIPEELADLRAQLKKDEAALELAIAKAVEDISEASRWFLVADIQFDFNERLLLLKNRRGPLDKFTAAVGGAPKRVKSIIEEWTEARQVSQRVSSPKPVIDRIDQLLHSAQLIHLRLGRAESAIVRTGAYFERMKGTIESLLQRSDADAPSLIRDFAHRSERPSERALPPLAEIFASVIETLKKNKRSFSVFLSVSAPSLAFHFLLLAFLIFSLRKCRGYVEREDSSSSPSDHLVLRHPWAGSFLIAAVATLFIYTVLPAVVGLLALSIAVVAAGFMLLDEPTSDNRLLAGGSLGLTLFLGAHMCLIRVPAVEQWFIGLEGLLVLFLSFQLSRNRAMTWSGWWKTLLVFTTRFWMTCATLGLVMWFIGLDRSSSILIDGTARLMLLTVAFRVAYDVVESIITLGAQSPWALHLNAFRHKGPLIAARLSLFVRWFFMYLWARSVCSSYTILNEVTETWDSLLEESITAGSISLQFGSLITLGVGIFLAVAASRFTSFALEEDILPRTRLGVGSSAAVTSGAGYVILGFGLFTSLAAVGFELDKIAILVSALGVGIGFGLQNIVQNFVAGLILIFGRPINVGDRVEVGGLFGTVKKVGFRASTVHTIQGAEVIVPNSQFVADQVINWSLSDDQRRVELDIGVKYGTDPQVVIDILRAAAEAHPEVLSEPPIDTIFVAFGASSLDFQLRAWTAHGGRWMNIRSDLSIAIDAALKEANIEIPFPQQDLHIRSIDEEVAARLLPKTQAE